MPTSPLAVLGFGFVLGLRHALEAQQLQVRRGPRRVGEMADGVAWKGHAGAKVNSLLDPTPTRCHLLKPLPRAPFERSVEAEKVLKEILGNRDFRQVMDLE